MSRESRLCYHAVPKIMKTDVNWLNSPLEESKEANSNDGDFDAREENTNRKKRRLTMPNDTECNDAFDENLWNNIVDINEWQPFGDYISDCRINMNVRQVLENGEQTLNLH